MSLIEKLEQKEKEQKFSTIFWKPQPGEILEGIIRSRSETITIYGEQECINIETDDGAGVYIVFLSSLLKDLIDAEGAQEGDRIAIKFVGVKTSKKNKKKTYKDYVVVVEKGDEE